MAIPRWVWKEAAEVLGVVGIIAGIAFLGFELNQNNALLAAQARYNLIVQRADMNSRFGEQRILELMRKYEQGAELTPVEQSALYNITARMVEMWEWQYGEYKAGMLEKEQLPIANWRRTFHGEEILPTPTREHWENLKGVVSADFVGFMEENVIHVD